MRALHDRMGATTLLVSHDREEAFAVADRVVIIHGGKVEQIGAAPAITKPSPRVASVSPGPSLESTTRRAIEDALTQTRGRIEGEDGAALLLGLHPATLRSRMRRLGIEWKQFRSTQR